MSGIGPIVDSLHLANEIDGHLLYDWRICSWDGRPVPLTGGAQIPADAAFGDAIQCDWLIVISERYQQFADYRLFLQSLARVGSRTPRVTGIHHGVWWLAMAGQLSAYRVAVNWETYQQFAEEFFTKAARWAVLSGAIAWIAVVWFGWFAFRAFVPIWGAGIATVAVVLIARFVGKKGVIEG